MHSAGAGDVPQLAALLEAQPALLDARVGFEEQSALLKAADAGAREVVEFLLAAGASPNLQDYLGRNALYLAAVRGHEDVVDLVLQHGADPSNARNNFRSTALMAAATNGSLGVVRLLLRHHGGKGLVNEVDEDNKTALWWACLRGHAEVRTIIDIRGSIHVYEVCRECRGRSTLIRAPRLLSQAVGWLKLVALRLSPQVVRVLLLEGHANHRKADRCRRMRRTPKQIAEAMGHMACVRLIEVS